MLDVYSKIILSVIAAALLLIAFKPDATIAQRLGCSGSFADPCYIALRN